MLTKLYISHLPAPQHLRSVFMHYFLGVHKTLYSQGFMKWNESKWCVFKKISIPSNYVKSVIQSMSYQHEKKGYLLMPKKRANKPVEPPDKT
jgi:hypothetical protein